MKKITFVLFFISISIFAQKPNFKGRNIPKITLTGKIIETSSKQPLEYATMILTHVKSKRVTGGVTDSNGNFSIEVPKGLYNMTVEFIGFKTKKLPQRKLIENTNIGTIMLSEDAETLDEVEIIAEKSTVEIKLDKKIYNVGKDMTIKGGNASDVLDNVPSVSVDAEGSVSLRGNDNVRILINGKPSALVGLNGTDALRNLPADAIEKVEVITSPSARYDAEGTAGILNIILRKGKVTGFNGSINTTLGHPAQYGIGGNINYRTKKVNIFTNLGYRYRKGPGNSQTFISNYKDGKIISYRNEDRVFDRRNNNYNSSIGLEYYLTKSSSITGTFFYGNSDGEDIVTNIAKSFNANKDLQKTSRRIESETEKEQNKQYSLNYTNNFGNKGQKLTIDLQYENSNENEDSPVTQDNSIIEFNSQITSSKNKLFQVDYTLPIGEKSQFEIGHKSDLKDLVSDFQQRNENKVLQIPPSNAIDFKQYIYAFYTQFGSKINKFSYLLGLRAEITDVDLLVTTTNQLSDKNYTQWFPTINLGYELSDNNNLTLGYARRLQRPRSWFLNPFETRSSATLFFRGNPDLNPTYTSSVDLGYNTKINKFNLGASVYYQYSTDIMQGVSILDDRIENNIKKTVTIKQPINLNDEKRYGFEFTSNYNPSRKVRLTASFNFFKFKTDAFNYVFTSTNGNQVTTNLKEVNESSWFARFNSKITLPLKVQWQTRLMYRGPKSTAQSDRKGMFNLNLAFSKDLFKEKATLVLNVSDVLNSRKREGITYLGSRENPTSILDGAFQWRERQITLNFTYRFNQKKKRTRPQRNYDGGGGGF